MIHVMEWEDYRKETDEKISGKGKVNRQITQETKQIQTTTTTRTTAKDDGEQRNKQWTRRKLSRGMKTNCKEEKEVDFSENKAGKILARSKKRSKWDLGERWV